MEGLRMSMDYKGMAVYGHQKNPHLRRFSRARSQPLSGTRMVARQEGVKTLLRGFKNGLLLQLSPDMDLGPRDAVFVPFFGVPAATVTALVAAGPVDRRRIVRGYRASCPGTKAM